MDLVSSRLGDSRIRLGRSRYVWKYNGRLLVTAVSEFGKQYCVDISFCVCVCVAVNGEYPPTYLSSSAGSFNFALSCTVLCA